MLDSVVKRCNSCNQCWDKIIDLNKMTLAKEGLRGGVRAAECAA